jgi:hypothetical protein
MSMDYRMKRIFVYVLILLSITFPCYAVSYQIVTKGDSIMAGFGGTDPSIALGTCTSKTHINKAVNCTGMVTALGTLPAELSSYTPQRVYSNMGINDCRNAAVDACGGNNNAVNLATFMADYATFLSDVTGAGATLYPLLITPDCGDTYTSTDWSEIIGIWNATIEDWAYTNNLKLAPTNQELKSTTSENCLATSYDYGDHLHLASAGDAVYSYLMCDTATAIPTRSRDWGSSSYPLMGHDSLSFWSITGGSLVGGTTDGTTGHIKNGTLTLGSSDSAVSPVLAILPPSGKGISITITGTGSPTISYRHSASIFTMGSAGAWTTYTGNFAPLSAGTAEFIQIKLAGTSGSTLVNLSWNDTAYTPPTSTTAFNGVKPLGCKALQ